MTSPSLESWWNAMGRVRVRLLGLALVGKVLLSIVSPPTFLSSAPLILPRQNTKAYLERAFLHRRLGHFDAALDDCTKVLILMRFQVETNYPWPRC